MPGFDGTGPMGYGPVTGWGRGFCRGGGGGRRGRGRGFRGGFGGGPGRGWGWRRGMWDAADDPACERNRLEAAHAALSEELDEVKRQLERLSAADTAEAP